MGETQLGRSPNYSVTRAPRTRAVFGKRQQVAVSEDFGSFLSVEVD